MSRKSNTDAIVKLAKEKSKEVRNRVEKTLSEMSLKNERINFNSVSQRAQVSKSWLYKEHDIRERIEVLRERQIKATYNTPKKSTRSEEVLIKSLKKRIKELEEENSKLKNQLERSYSQYFE